MLYLIYPYGSSDIFPVTPYRVHVSCTCGLVRCDRSSGYPHKQAHSSVRGAGLSTFAGFTAVPQMLANSTQ
eukprot:5873371-Pleurochrysis_carterae.AAC.1